MEEQIAKPLGLDVYKAAAGVLELFEDHLRNSLLGLAALPLAVAIAGAV